MIKFLKQSQHDWKEYLTEMLKETLENQDPSINQNYYKSWTLQIWRMTIKYLQERCDTDYTHLQEVYKVCKKYKRSQKANYSFWKRLTSRRITVEEDNLPKFQEELFKKIKQSLRNPENPLTSLILHMMELLSKEISFFNSNMAPWEKILT